jgi:hypothetical protein
MKHSKTMLAGLILLLAAALPSIAMAQQDVFGDKMNKFLNDHPDVAAKVRSDPSLLYSKQFRHEHPDLQTFMQNHPETYTRLEQHGVYSGGHGAGAYDQNHQWRSANWWHQNNPNWANQNHPEWAQSHPEWNNHPVGGAPNEAFHETAPNEAVAHEPMVHEPVTNEAYAHGATAVHEPGAYQANSAAPKHHHHN